MRMTRTQTLDLYFTLLCTPLHSAALALPCPPCAAQLKAYRARDLRHSKCTAHATSRDSKSTPRVAQTVQVDFEGSIL